MPIKDPDKQRVDSNRLGRKAQLAKRDITEDYPPTGDMDRRAACERDLRLFCETYFPNAFYFGWTDDHLKAISRMQEVVLDGGLYALAMPRGFGKTTLTCRAALWSLLYGHRRFVALIGQTEKRAEQLLETIKTELSFNEMLGQDFRQVCYPIRRLENNGRLAIGQLFDAEETRIKWGVDQLTFPAMPDWACDGVNVSQATVTVAGLTGAIRGQSGTLKDGTVIRPELAILDDPQTRGSAMSLSQSETRAAIIKGDVLGMAGPGKKIAAVMPCTVIRIGDMSDTILDRKKNPEWSGLKTKLVYAFPKNMPLWDKYREIRSEDLMFELGVARCNQFYLDNQTAMDEGAIVPWTERFDPGSEHSAIQAAMNLLFLDERSFHAEYQNQPLPELEPSGDELTHDQIASKINRMAEGLVPIGCNRITAFIDVHHTVLYYVVAAWEDDFTGYIITYGTHPEQARPYYTLRDAKHTMAKAAPHDGLEGQIRAGLKALTTSLLGREWQRDDGVTLKVDRCLIDANEGMVRPVVYQFCRESAHASVLTPSHGKYVGASMTPMAEWKKQEGDRVGLNWRLRNMEGKRSVRSVLFDTNWFKSLLNARLATAMGDRGCLSLFGESESHHRLFVDHLLAEFKVRTEGRGRSCDEWKLKPNHDNHYLDATVGCCVAASMQGVVLPQIQATVMAKTKRPSFVELQRRAQEQRRNQPPNQPRP